MAFAPERPPEDMAQGPSLGIKQKGLFGGATLSGVYISDKMNISRYLIELHFKRDSCLVVVRTLASEWRARCKVRMDQPLLFGERRVAGRRISGSFRLWSFDVCESKDVELSSGLIIPCRSIPWCESAPPHGRFLA